MLLYATEALAKESSKADLFDQGEPAWTLKIPEGRYPCLCDTPPHLWGNKSSSTRSDLDLDFEMNESQFQEHIERIIFSRLKLLIEHKFEKVGLLSCEVKYKLTRERSIKDVEIVVSSKNSEFDSDVLKALESLRFGFVGYPQKQGKKFIEFQSVITPVGVYAGYSGKLNKQTVPVFDNQADKLFQ